MAHEDSSNPSPTGALAAALDRSLYSDSLDCVHCGLCLSSCPTYLATGRESSSPRGRIYLMRGVAEGRLTETETLEEEAFLCLGCRACETACPSGVPYGQMLEHARDAIRTTEAETRVATRVERFILREIIPHPSRLSRVVWFLGLTQRLGLDRLAGMLGPRRLKEMIALAPVVPEASRRVRMPELTPAIGERRGAVVLFEGCVMPEFFGRVNDAARRLLARAGYDVLVPPEMGCCGALQAHSGDLDFARDLARENTTALARVKGKIDAVVVTSAGCSAALREVETWLGESGHALATGVRDVLEFLDEVDAELDLSPLPLRVCYDDPCHLIHAQGIGKAPRRLLARVPELEIVGHKDPEACCGAAGIYNLTHPEMSQKVLSPKLDALIAANPEVVATANPGCAMQLASGLASRGCLVEVVHPLELLDRATRDA